MNRFSTLALSTLLALAALLNGCAFETAVGASTAEVTGRPYFEVYEGSDGQHRFRLKAANHQIILASQGYSSRSAALGGVLSVVDNGYRHDRFELRLASNGEHYFVLKAANGRVIGTGELYSSRSNAAAGIDAVVRNIDTYQEWLATRSGARFEVFRGADGRFYFNLFAQNGEIVLSSQGYSSESAAYNGVFSVATHGVSEARYAVNESADGGFYFNLRASNGRVIGTSEVYASRSNAERGRDAVMALLPNVELL